MSLDQYLSRSVTWARTGEAEFPYQATVGGRKWRVRINDFPDEVLYTLLIDGEAIGDFDNWPEAWVRPA